MATDNTESTYIVRIEKVVNGGAGLSHLDGRVLFVRQTAPGDQVKVRITEKHDRYWVGELIEILSPSPLRINPSCPVFTSCGGCDWQHLKYSDQVKIKEQILQEELRHLDLVRTQVHPLLKSPNEKYYRNRAQFHIADGSFGYFARGSHRFIAINKCELVVDSINQALKELDAKNLGPEERVELFHDEGKQTYSLRKPDRGDFSQVNSEQNKKLLELVCNLAAEGDESYLYDLYSGAGNFFFSLIAQKKWKRAVGCELGQESALRAQDQLKKTNSSPKYLEFYCADVWSFLRRSRLKPNSLVVIDPPRAGCESSVIRALAHSPIKRLIYVSCNISTFQRDMRLFLSLQPKSFIKNIFPVDMFPQTAHIELVAEVVIDSTALNASL